MPGNPSPRRTLLPAPLRARVGAALAAALWLGTTPAPALQLIEARDGVSVEAVLSLREPTRIRIENEPITDVFGNIHSSHCGSGASSPAIPGAPGLAAPGTLAINPAGELVVECDRDKGEVYLRPVGTATKPINLFVASAGATYTLLLRPSDTPADTIVLRDRTPKALKALPGQAAAGPAPGHLRALKGLLLAMASDRVPPDIRVEEAVRPIQLWAEVRVSLLRLYEGRGLIGEKYLLQNVSDQPLVLAEPEFDRPDSPAGGSVAGVAIEQHNLRPGDSTGVYVIRRGSTTP